jgi:quercetin dioxygenase-like cupin family protein
MSYESTTVRKPWGYEYLAYENDQVGLWFLHISKGQSTSMHCHPKKTTGLVLLDGKAEVSFLADKRQIDSLDKVMIRRGLFHSTKALSDGGAFVFEIETPKDKHDLVRLSDSYGRTSKPYEDSSFESFKTQDCLWIEEPPKGTGVTYGFANCNLLVENINDIEVINKKQDTDLIVFLKGGLVRDINSTSHLVTTPGDVGYAGIVKQVSRQLDGVVSDTLIMTITKNE